MEEEMLNRKQNRLYSIFKKLQKLLHKTKILKYPGRQPYHVGWLAPGKSLGDLRLYLHANWGFGGKFMSFEDAEQVLSWRKIEPHGGQYHIRVFKDGEIRGHYEKMPETGVLEHLSERGQHEAKEDFVKFLGDCMVEKKHLSNITRDPNALEPEAEILEPSEQK